MKHVKLFLTIVVAIVVSVSVLYSLHAGMSKYRAFRDTRDAKEAHEKTQRAQEKALRAANLYCQTVNHDPHAFYDGAAAGGGDDCYVLPVDSFQYLQRVITDKGAAIPARMQPTRHLVSSSDVYDSRDEYNGDGNEPVENLKWERDEWCRRANNDPETHAQEMLGRYGCRTSDGHFAQWQSDRGLETSQDIATAKRMCTEACSPADIHAE